MAVVGGVVVGERALSTGDGSLLLPRAHSCTEASFSYRFTRVPRYQTNMRSQRALFTRSRVDDAQRRHRVASNRFFCGPDHRCWA